MKKNSALLTFLLFFGSALWAQNMKLEFVENKGQWGDQFQYKCSSGSGELFVHNNAITYLFAEQGAWDKMDAHKHNPAKNPVTIKMHAYKMNFIGCNNAKIKASKFAPHYYNYFLGADTSKWKSHIYPAMALDFEQLYPGIDLHFASADNNPKYDFIVHPNADPAQIKLGFEGVDKLSIDKKGNLIIKTSLGDIKEMSPEVFQYINDQKTQVPCQFVVQGNTVSFKFPEGYDRSKILIIDPTIVFSTYSGSTADNFGFTATFDDLGNMYTGGLVSTINGGVYPVTLGAFQATYGGGTTTSGGGYPCDIAVMKLNSTGSAVIYATYLGGSDNDQPHSLVVDRFYNLVIAGRTYSNDYPTSATAYDRTHNGQADLVITVLNSTGSALVGSTYLGGSADDAVNFSAVPTEGGNLKHNFGDDARSEVIVDNVGNIYCAASTFSSNFPTQNPIQSTLGGGQDAVIVKLNNNLSSLLFSTYLGGSQDDGGYVITLNQAQSSFFVGGGTMSTNFPTTSGTYRSSFIGGSTDGYVVKILNAAPFTLQRSTFIGASGYDQVYGVAIDGADNLYFMGQTLGGGFPVSAGVYSNPNSSQFVMKMDNNLTSPIFSTVFGSGTSSTTNISPVAFIVDTCQNIYISGWGGVLGGIEFPTAGTTTGLPVTPSAHKSTTDGHDFYFIVFNTDATSLLYATYYGGNTTVAALGEHVDGGTSRFDKNGIIYQAICAGCGGNSFFPTTPGVISPTNASRNCNLGALKIEFGIGPAVSRAEPFPTNKGCAPLTVEFKNKSINAKSFVWDFADGSPTSTSAEPTHTFYKPGTYRVRLIVHNPDACLKAKVYDTSYLDIIVDSNSIAADFDAVILDSCVAPFEVRFANTSTFGTSGTASFVWDFGDGSTPYTGATPPVYNYAKTGTYTITLVMNDPLACNNPDTIKKTITIDSKRLRVSADIPDALCAKNGAVKFTSSTQNASSILWDFGDGKTSTEFNPTHTYDTGTYWIKVYVFNPGACNTSDSFFKRIVIKSGAKADFDFTPKIPIENDSTYFKNLSQNALSYLWIFGDGAQSRAKDPAHLYKKTGTFRTCLVAVGFENCNDTICKDVSALVVPRIDVPTAFTPNNDQVNDILYVRGAAVESMDFRIYNRWGQEVFRSNSMEVGWDGTFNGKPQPMESYAYVLNATFINGESETKRGNITLLE